MTTLTAYDVRVEIRPGARLTVRVAARNADEAREQTQHYRPTADIVAVRRSPYAIGASHRAALKHYRQVAS